MHIVVAGGGLAGHAVLRELRRLSPEVKLTMITADDGHFYSKPALSTALAKEKTPDGLVTMPAQKVAAQVKFDLLANCQIEAIDAAARVLQTKQGLVGYDKLVLALGAAPIRAPFTGDAADDVVSVNSLDDYRIFRDRLRAGADVLIVGAGLVGSEFANDLAHAGWRVHLVDVLEHPLAQLAPAPIGRRLERALAALGVRGHFARKVISINRADDRYAVTLDDGTVIEVDLVLSAIGLRPRVALGERAGLAIGRGIKVDASGRTSDPSIYALGDCAEYERGLAAYVTPIAAAARGIASSALGTPTEIRFPPLSVQVKTTACPIVLLPPEAGVAGAWCATQEGEDGAKYLFVAAGGGMHGYVLAGAQCDERSELDKQISG